MCQWNCAAELVLLLRGRVHSSLGRVHVVEAARRGEVRAVREWSGQGGAGERD